MDFPPWPIPEWSWIIPVWNSEGLFCSSGPTLCWCNAPSLCFSDECAREGPHQEEGSCCLVPKEHGEIEEAWEHRCLQQMKLIAHTEFGKFTLSLLLLTLDNCPLPPPLPISFPLAHLRPSDPESSSFITRELWFPETDFRDHTSLPM